MFGEGESPGDVDVVEGDVAGMRNVDAVGGVIGESAVLLAVGGADVVLAAGPLALVVEGDLDVVELDIFEGGVGGTGEEDAVFGEAGDVEEADVANFTGGVAVVAGNGGDVDGFGAAPVEGVKKSGFNAAVAEGDVFDGALVAKLDGEASVAGVDDAVVDADVAEVAGAFGAEFDGGGGADDGGVADEDVFAGAEVFVFVGIFEDDAVVGGFDVATDDADVAAVVGADAVAVGDIETVEDVEALGEDVFAAGEMDRPGGGVAVGEVGESDVPAAVEGDAAGTPGFGGADVGFGPPAVHVVEGTTVDCAGSGDGEVFGIPGLDENATGAAAVKAVDLDVLEILGIGGGFEAGTGFEVEVDMAFKVEGSGEMKAGAEGDASASGGGNLVDCGLDSVG